MDCLTLPLVDDEATFGGKAVSLGAAIRAGLPVPPGVALAASLVDRIAAGNASALAVLTDSPDLPRARLAVRSSAVGEDSAGASFAGQHATRLNVTIPALGDAVREVWESARSESARAYRVRKGLSLEPRIGVVVQMLVDSVAAGVLFTRDPVTGADERIIEAAWGLGEAVVNGIVIPDRFRLDPTGRLIEFSPGQKDVKVWYREAGGTVELPVPPDLHSVPCLRDGHVRALMDVADECLRLCGPSLDLEWALGPDEAIYLLQNRPITTLAARV